MGTESIELICRIEEELGVVFPPFPWSRDLTVRELLAYVQRALDAQNDLSAIADRLEVLRGAVAEATGVEEEALVPSTPLSHIAPAKGREVVWSKVKSRLASKGYYVPRLRPAWHLGKVTFLISVFAGVGAAYAAYQLLGILAAWGAGIFCFLVSFLVVEGVFCRLSPKVFPSNRETLADMAKIMSSSSLAIEGMSASDFGEERLKALTAALAAETGIPRDKISSSSRLTEIIPKAKRKDVWRKVDSSLAGEGYKLPGLRLPIIVYPAMAALACLPAVCVATPFRGDVFLLVAIATGIGMAFLVYALSERIFRSKLPAKCETVEDLAELICLRPLSQRTPGGRSLRPTNTDALQDHERKIIGLISEVTGMPCDEIALDAYLFGDLLR